MGIPVLENEVCPFVFVNFRFFNHDLGSERQNARQNYRTFMIREAITCRAKPHGKLTCKHLQITSDKIIGLYLGGS